MFLIQIPEKTQIAFLPLHRKEVIFLHFQISSSKFFLRAVSEGSGHRSGPPGHLLFSAIFQILLSPGISGISFYKHSVRPESDTHRSHSLSGMVDICFQDIRTLWPIIPVKHQKRKNLSPQIIGIHLKPTGTFPGDIQKFIHGSKPEFHQIHEGSLHHRFPCRYT